MEDQHITQPEDGTMMKAIVVKELGSFEICTFPIPQPGPGEVLLKVEVTGLCRTDLKIIEVGHRDLVMPRVPGEEVVGEICAIGADVPGFADGQRVYVYPGTSCEKCPPCLAGAGNLCKSMQIMGFHRDGGFAEYVVAPAQSLIHVPENLTPDQAVFAEPLSCCLNAIELSRLQADETICIWGGGPAGLLLSRAALAKGAVPTIIEPNSKRREFSNSLPAVPANEMYDVCIIAVGDMAAYQEAIDHLKPRGRLIVFSGLPKDDYELACDFNKLHYLEQTIVGAYGCSYRHGEEALALLAAGKVKVDDMVSHRMELWDLKEALRLVSEKISIKVLLYP
ncbi:MAG: alcohol dehydrogenase catalytic domain-containing protein [Desulfobulbaceae bacterium]|nr:alcohol dehydrogenase catalytic domain-containing protein [Desulfobulbaceae bacterium]